MQYTGPTYRFPPTVPERLYPTGVYVDRTLHVGAISRLRTARNFTKFFLASGYHHLPRGSPTMFRVEEVIQTGWRLLSLPTSPTHSKPSTSSVGCFGVAPSSSLSPPTTGSRSTTTSSPPRRACTLFRTPSTTPRRSSEKVRRRSEVEKAAARVLNPLSLFGLCYVKLY